MLDGRPLHRVTFTALLPETLRDAPGPGQVWLDAYYCDERVAGISFAVELASKSTASGKQVCPLEQITTPGLAAAQRDFLREMASQVLPLNPRELPQPISASYRSLRKAASAFERAGWIPLVLEAFLQYHVTLAGEPALESPQGRQTLGLLRSRFERIIAKRYLKNSPPLQCLPYLRTYRQQAVRALLSSLLDYRNRIWGHPAFFPTEAQCRALEEAYGPKLEVILGILVSPDNPVSLVATGEDGVPEVITPFMGLASLPGTFEPAKPHQVYLVSSSGWIPLDPLVVWRSCQRCGGRHLRLAVGQKGDRLVYKAATGSCPAMDLRGMLAE